MPFLHKCLSAILLLIAISMPAMAKTQATASVNANTVYLGDTFVLTVEVNDTGSEYQFDSKALSEDFTVGRPSRSQQTMYVNGEFTQKITWSLRLQAKKIGSLTIPSFTLGDVNTNAITINVKKPGKAQQSTSKDTIFIENSLNKNSVYVDQPVILESKIYVSENVVDGDIQLPILEGANIERISDNLPQSQLVRNGMRYQVFTYQYKITPTIAGDDNITSPLLVGSVRNIVRSNGFQNNITSTPVNVRGNDLSLTVKGMPADYQGDWLISEDVRLIENNNLQEKEYAVGDPITRSISLQVAGIALDKMPEIEPNYDSSLRYYPDQDDLKQGTVNDVLYSQRTITHAIIANKAGKLVLPEIKVAWWNSKTEKQEFATLAAQTLNIKPALANNNNLNSNVNNNVANNNANNNVGSNINNSQQNLPDAEPLNDANRSQGLAKNEALSKQLIIWQISTFILLLLLILLSIYHLRSKRVSTTTLSSTDTSRSNNQQYQRLLTALEEAKANNVYACLLKYFQTQHPSISVLQQVGSFTQLNEDNKQQLLENLNQLELACSGMSHQWDAKNLLKLIKLHHKTAMNNDFIPINRINP